MSLNYLDFAILIAYVLMVVSVGVVAAWLQKRKSAGSAAAAEEGAYFLAARTLPWPIIGLSLFSTNISTVHIVALCQEGFRSGLAYANFELGAVFTLVILAVFFVPFYLRARVTTLPDFLEKRYSRSCRDFLAFLSILTAIFIHIGVSLYAGGVVINAMMGIPGDLAHLMPTMIAIAVATGIYVVIGGLLSVTLTDAIQTTTLLLGSAIVTFFAFRKLGGWGELEGAVGPHMLSVLRPTGDFSGMPWHAALIGYPVIGIWYWCTEQTIVQRVLGAKDEDNGKAGALFAGFLKLLPMFLFVLPGLLCLALVYTGKIPPLADSKNAFAHMVMNLLPPGMRGLIVAALLAALMGTIAGALNSIATLFAYDLYKRFRPDTSEKKLVHIGRAATITGVVFAILWSPVIGKFDTIYNAIATMICYVAPPLSVTLTDAIQTTTLLLGSAIVTFFAFRKLGGWGELEGAVGPHMLSVLRPTGDFSGMPWHAALIGYPVIGIWYWCTEQTIVQRVLGAKDEDNGKAGALFAGFLKLLPMFLFVLPGLLCLALVYTGKIPPLADSKNAFAHMVMNLLPPGMRGLIVAALLAALMGTIAGALNSIATLFAYDLYKRFRPDTSEKKLVHIGRAATITGVVFAILWSPVIGKFDTIYNAIATMICYVAPPITAVFMVGIFWKRATAKAAIITLWGGFALGMIVFALDFYKEYTHWNMLFMHASGLLCLICLVLMVVVSLLTPDTNTEENRKLVWDSPLTPLRIPGAKGLLNYKLLSIVVMLAASTIYYIFRSPSPERLAEWKAAHPGSAARIEEHIRNPKQEAAEMAAASAEYEKQMQKKKGEQEHE